MLLWNEEETDEEKFLIERMNSSSQNLLEQAIILTYCRTEFTEPYQVITVYQDPMLRSKGCTTIKLKRADHTKHNSMYLCKYLFPQYL